MGLIDGIASVGMGLMMQGQADRRQIKQQEKLMGLQMKGNKEMLEAQRQKEMQMWKDTSYPAQMEMMKKAGINPALMYGMGGGGGVTTGGGGSQVSAGSAPVGGGEIGMGIQTMAQVRLLEAQRKNIDADTANKLGDAANKPKVGANLDADTGIKQVQTRIAQIDEKIKDKTWDDAVDIIGSEAQIAFETAERLNRENRFGKEAYETMLKTLKAELGLKIVQTGLAKAQTTTEHGKPAVQKAEIGLMKEQADAVFRSINLGWERLNMDMKNSGYDNREKAQRTLVNDVANSEQVPIDMVEKIVQALLLKGILGGNEREPIKGFRR